MTRKLVRCCNAILLKPLWLSEQVSQRPDAAEIVERLQAAMPAGLATSSSRSLSSVASASLRAIAASAPRSLPPQQELQDPEAGSAGGEAAQQQHAAGTVGGVATALPAGNAGGVPDTADGAVN